VSQKNGVLGKKGQADEESRAKEKALCPSVFLHTANILAHCILAVFGSAYKHPVRSAYQPPASSTFLSQRTSHQQPAATSQQYSSLRTNQHQPSATSQPNRLDV
jgi:hypothetical protein